jgi:hypothetical protein
MYRGNYDSIFVVKEKGKQSGQYEDRKEQRSAYWW